MLPNRWALWSVAIHKLPVIMHSSARPKIQPVKWNCRLQNLQHNKLYFRQRNKEITSPVTGWWVAATPPFIRCECSGTIPLRSPLLAAFLWDDDDDTFFRFQDLRTPHLLFDEDVWWMFTVVSRGSHNTLLVTVRCSLASLCWSARKRHVSRMLSSRHTSNSCASCCWFPSKMGFTSLRNTWQSQYAT